MNVDKTGGNNSSGDECFTNGFVVVFGGLGGYDWNMKVDSPRYSRSPNCDFVQAFRARLGTFMQIVQIVQIGDVFEDGFPRGVKAVVIKFLWLLRERTGIIITPTRQIRKQLASFGHAKEDITTAHHLRNLSVNC